MKSRCLALWLLTLLAMGVKVDAQVATGLDTLAPEALAPADIRLVVDISGSMARTDPNNLRRPALSLLVRLLPPESRAGVWTFGESTNTLIPHGQTDKDWKARALTRVDDINSVALYTHIGAALEAAAYDRDPLEASDRRADIILLTDGMVDVSPDAAISAREQQRVVNTLVPELRAAGYRVHTIGLSDEADEDLLRQIARRADGLFSRARNAEDLMNSLLLIFQQTVPADQLPINDGFFLIDDSVQEFTALIRREPGQTPTRLIDPKDREYRYPPDLATMNWHHTENYDLITVTDPLPGRWKIQADLQPFSRLTVISDLKLVVEPLPNNTHVGEDLPLRFHLRDDNGVIDQPGVLNVLTMTLEIRDPDNEVIVQRSGPKTPPDDGVYELSLPAPERPGDYDMRLRLDGKTFERLYTHQLAVASQFEVSFTKRHEQERVIWTLVVDGKETLNPEQTSLVAHVRNSNGDSSVRALDPTERGLWVLELTPEHRGHYRISLKASGQTLEGTRFEEHLPSQYFSYPEVDDPEPDPVGEAIDNLQGELAAEREATALARRGEATEAPVSTIKLSNGDEPPPAASVEKPSTAKRKSTHPAVLVGSLVLANGLLLVVAYLAYRAIVGGRKVEPVLQDDAEADTTDTTAGEAPLMQSIDTDAAPPPSQGEADNAPETGDSFDLEDEDPLFPLSDEDDEPRS